jgi:hypothetical protein
VESDVPPSARSNPPSQFYVQDEEKGLLMLRNARIALWPALCGSIVGSLRLAFAAPASAPNPKANVAPIRFNLCPAVFRSFPTRSPSCRQAPVLGGGQRWAYAYSRGQQGKN